jgi:uncharacterized protein
MKSCLIIFAKMPLLGKVKTRLAQDLPKGVVLIFYKRLLKHVLSLAKEVRCDGRYLFLTGSESGIDFFHPYRQDYKFRRQNGRNLGQRMMSAFTYAHRQGFNRMVIIGADCPELRRNDINRAFKKLVDYDIVLGPACDGGYYLIGLSHPESKLFTKIAWSSETVLKQTITRARKLKKRVFLLRQIRDIDTISDLRKFMKTVEARRIGIPETIKEKFLHQLANFH